jgi:hypothetical protein
MGMSASGKVACKKKRAAIFGLPFALWNRRFGSGSANPI